MGHRFTAVALLLLSLTGPSWGDGGDGSLRAMKAWKAMQARVQSDIYSEANIKMLEGFVRSFPTSDYAADARFAIAEIYFRSGKYANAWPQYKFLLERKNGVYEDDILLRMGEIQYNTGNIKNAREYWNKIIGKVIKRSVLSAEARYYIILCDLREKNYMSANKNLQLLLEKAPTYRDLPRIRELTGIIRFQEKNFNKVLEIFEDVATPSGEFYRGLSCFELKQYLEAAECFKKLSAGARDGYSEMGAYLKAESFRLGKNNNLATQAYGQFVNEYPKSRLRPYALVHLARALINSKKYDKALEVLGVVDRTPGASKSVAIYAMYLQAAIFGKTGDPGRAVDLLNSALTLVIRRDSPELYGSILAAKGYYLLKQGDFPQAALIMKKLVDEMPYHPLGMAAYMIMGNAKYMDKDWNAAITAYETALLNYKYSELSDVAMAMLLRTYYAAGRYPELVTNANRVMKVVISEFATQNDLWRSYSYFLLAEAYYKLGQYAKSSEYYQKAGRNQAWEPLARLYLAWSLYHEGKYSESVTLAQQVLATSENTYTGKASAGFLVAASLFNQKQYEQAITAFRSFRRDFPRDSHVPESYLQEGMACKMARYYKDARLVWDKLVELFPADPSAPEAQLNIGRLYFQGRKYDLAVKAFEVLLKKWPGTALASEAQWMTAQSYYNSKEYDEAIPAYEVFINGHPKDPRLESCREQLMLAYYNRAINTKDPGFLAHFVHTYPKSSLAAEAQYMLGFVAYSKQDWAGAVKHMRDLLLNYPGDPQAATALLAVARALEHLNNTESAVEEYESVMTMFPSTTYAQDAAMRLGAIYFSGGKFRDAAKKFVFLSEHSPEGPVKMDAVYNTAVSYKRGHDYVDALKAYESFADKYEDDPRQIDALLEIAGINRNNDEYQKILNAYQRILESKNPAATPALRMQIYGQIGEIYLKTAEDRKKAIVAYRQLIPMKPYGDDARLLGLAQLAAIYETDEDWVNAKDVYNQITASGGRADWVQTAAGRLKEINKYLEAKSRLPAGVPAGKADGGQPPEAGPAPADPGK
ncbi:MAG: tetratricopeptide repeat protein [Elusimicrobiales bacterium]|jgi:TolA-binding protein